MKFKARLGPNEGQKSVRVLNRIVSWDDQGLVYEPDQRHAEIIVRDLGLEHANPMCTPGLSEKVQEDEAELDSEWATKYRALVAHAIYLAQDRPELAYAAEEAFPDISVSDD